MKDPVFDGLREDIQNLRGLLNRLEDRVNRADRRQIFHEFNLEEFIPTAQQIADRWNREASSKIRMIKQFREATGLGLMQSKAVIEEALDRGISL